MVEGSWRSAEHSLQSGNRQFSNSERYFFSGITVEFYQGSNRWIKGVEFEVLAVAMVQTLMQIEHWYYHD